MFSICRLIRKHFNRLFSRNNTNHSPALHSGQYTKPETIISIPDVPNEFLKKGPWKLSCMMLPSDQQTFGREFDSQTPYFMPCTNLFFINSPPQIKHIFYSPYSVQIWTAMPWKIFSVSKILQTTHVIKRHSGIAVRRGASNCVCTDCCLAL